MFTKVPALIAIGVICLIVGVGIGAVGATTLRLTTGDLRFWERGEDAKAAEGDQKGAAKGGMGMGGMGMGGMGKGGMGKGKGPSAKAQLTSLVAKLDILTQKPLTLSLDDGQKKKIQEHLQGLSTLDELTEDDAKQRLDGLLEVVKDQKEPLQVVGFRWPGAQGGPMAPPGERANPFKEFAGAEQLRSLEKRLAKTAP